MVIYGEYLFLENALAGLVILTLTNHLCGYRASWKRLLAGSVVCGLYSFLLFWEGLPWWGGLFMKLAFSVCIVKLVFQSGGWKRLGRTLLIFYLISFTMGGVAIGAMYFFRLTGVTGAGAFYIGQITYGQVFLGIALTYVGLTLFSSFLKERTRKGRAGIKVEVTIGENSALFKGMVDTGNFLADPSTGKPVSLVSQVAMQRLVPEWERIEQGHVDTDSAFYGKVHWIPFQSIGMKSGLLTGISPDQIVILDPKHGLRKADFLLAVYKGTFPMGWDGETIELLLHPAVMEGGILEGEQLEY